MIRYECILNFSTGIINNLNNFIFINKGNENFKKLFSESIRIKIQNYAIDMHSITNLFILYFRILDIIIDRCNLVYNHINKLVQHISFPSRGRRVDLMDAESVGIEY